MDKKKREFSKTLLIQESALIWVLSISFISLAFYCIYQGFAGTLPWLAAMVGFPWTAYGVSQMMYYKKSTLENTAGGIKYETVMEEARRVTSQCENTNEFIFENSIDPAVIPTYQATENVDNFQI